MAFPQKYKVLIDDVDYIDSVVNWQKFLPVTRRSKKYHSHISTFSETKLDLVKAAKKAVLAEKESHGTFASSTFEIQEFNWGTEVYDTLITGVIDYKTVQENKSDNHLFVKFIPDNQSEELLNRDDIVTDVTELVDFDGNAIIAFTNETHTIDLDAQTVPGFTSAATTTSEVMLAWELALRFAQKIIGRDDCLRSSLLGRTDGEVFTYASDGRRSLLSFASGFWVRGGASTDYGMKTALQDFFEFLYSVEPIGMGIEYISGNPFLVVEELDYFYDNSEIVWYVTNPQDLEIAFNDELIFGKILSGFRIFDKSGDEGFIISPHTERNYITGLDKISKKTYNIRTNYIASGVLIELTRFNQISSNAESSDFDEAIFVIQLRRSGGGFIREADEDLITSTNIANPTTIYNYRLFPARTLNNHLKWINATLKKQNDYKQANDGPYVGWNPILFQTGQGGTDAISQLNGEALAIAESENKSANVEPIRLDEELTFRTSIDTTTYQAVLAGIKKKVRVTFENLTFDCFIEEIKLKDTYTADVTLSKVNPDY